MPQHDAELVTRAREGDEAALTELYERYQPSVYTYIYYRTGCSALAEELTSEVFVRLVDKIQAFENRGVDLLAWLYTVARNLVISHYRREGRRQWLPLDEGLVAGEAANPFAAAERALTKDRLASALDCLTESQRQVILLKFIEGHSNAEVGTILGKDEGSVKSLQHRALAALRRVLEGRH